jgi:UDP-N-acetyl-2-amino-2-deoxyglucuronate dehydrogenase
MARDALVIVGCGYIARRHAAAARRLGMPLIFASRDAGRARAYARDFQAAGAYGSYAEALGDPRATAAVVCTPHDAHLRDTLAALDRGLHVLVEKPIARTLEEADQMIAAARSAGRVLMVAENFRFMPAFRAVHELIARGDLGALRELHLIARGFRRHAGWRRSEAAAGGGALIDGGIHYVHALRWWGGDVRRVVALRPPPTLSEFEGEDAISLLAVLESGAVGILSNSLAAPGIPRLQWSTVTGTRASCFVDNRGRFVLVRGERYPRLRLFRRDIRGHETMLAHLHHAIDTESPPESDGPSGRRDLAIVLAAYRSVAEQRSIALGP